MIIKKNDNNYKMYNRFNWLFDLVFFLPRHIMQFIRWLF